jgi:hypothetical protein
MVEISGSISSSSDSFSLSIESTTQEGFKGSHCNPFVGNEWMDVRTSRLVHNTVHYYHSFFDRLTVLCCHKVCGCLPINSGSCISCVPPVFFSLGYCSAE